MHSTERSSQAHQHSEAQAIDILAREFFFDVPSMHYFAKRYTEGSYVLLLQQTREDEQSITKYFSEHSEDLQPLIEIGLTVKHVQGRCFFPTTRGAHIKNQLSLRSVRVLVFSSDAHAGHPEMGLVAAINECARLSREQVDLFLNEQVPFDQVKKLTEEQAKALIRFKNKPLFKQAIAVLVEHPDFNDPNQLNAFFYSLPEDPSLLNSLIMRLMQCTTAQLVALSDFDRHQFHHKETSTPPSTLRKYGLTPESFTPEMKWFEDKEEKAEKEVKASDFALMSVSPEVPGLAPAPDVSPHVYPEALHILVVPFKFPILDAFNLLNPNYGFQPAWLNQDRKSKPINLSYQDWRIFRDDFSYRQKRHRDPCEFYGTTRDLTKDQMITVLILRSEHYRFQDFELAATAALALGNKKWITEGLRPENFLPFKKINYSQSQAVLSALSQDMQTTKDDVIEAMGLLSRISEQMPESSEERKDIGKSKNQQPTIKDIFKALETRASLDLNFRITKSHVIEAMRLLLQSAESREEQQVQEIVRAVTSTVHAVPALVVISEPVHERKRRGSSDRDPLLPLARDSAEPEPEPPVQLRSPPMFQPVPSEAPTPYPVSGDRTVSAVPPLAVESQSRSDDEPEVESSSGCTFCGIKLW